MINSDSPTRPRPLPRPLTLFILLLALTAFLPHRERALLLSGQGIDSILSTDTLANNSFFAPPPVGYYAGTLGDWPTGSIADATGPRRERFAPGRSLAVPRGGAVPTGAPAVPSNAGPGIVPLGAAANEAAPVFASAAPTPVAPGGAPGGSGPGGFGGFPGGGGSGGGGSIIPPAAVPEPGVWALMILGFGLIGSAVRRSRRALRRDTSAEGEPVAVH